MITLIAAFLTAALMALIATPLVLRLALRAGAVSNPGGRNVNVKVMPRLGGVAIAIAAVVPVALLFVVNSEVASHIRRASVLMGGLGLGALLMCGVGARDDMKGLRASTKLGVQVLCAILAYYAGFQIQKIYLPFIGVLEMGVFALPVTIFWVVGITNAVNLIDGLDGLAAGVVFCAAGTNLVVALLTGSFFVSLVMASVMGALMGFLFFNFNPARIFMGDSGSYFLGFVLATVSLAGNQKASTAVSLLVPVLALGVPIFDTLFSIVRRTLERRPIFSPDRGHLHHRLLDVGLTHRRAVLTLYLLSLLFSLTAVGASLGRDWETGAAILAATILIFGLIGFIRVFDRTHSQRTRCEDELVATLLQRLPAFVRGWKDTTELEEANIQLSELGRLPKVDSLRFEERHRLPRKQRGIIVIDGMSGQWALVLRASERISYEARALMRMIAQTADVAAEETRSRPNWDAPLAADRESGTLAAAGRPAKLSRSL